MVVAIVAVVTVVAVVAVVTVVAVVAVDGCCSKQLSRCPHNLDSTLISPK
ncbi:hypothetical protein [Paenibacillus sp. LC231]|nr:hypothetical protein [Paenibacillus sp. LC231]